MRGPQDDTVRFSRRAALLGIGGLGVFGALSARLYYLQVTQAEDYRVLSDRNRFNFHMIIPERGRILDRYGESLATNKQDFRLVMVAERVPDIDNTLSRIGDIVPLSPAAKSRIKRDISSNAKFVPVLIEEHLDWPAFSKLNMKLPDLPGVIPMEGTGRHYPHGGTFSHILGYVGTPGPDALEKDTDPLLRQPTFKMGKTGIEQSQDKTLRGKAGRQKVEVNAFGRIVREWNDDKIPAEPGKDVFLTIDADLQTLTAELFGEESGGAALMDVQTGELRTLLSMPTFDANVFVSGLTNAQMKALNDDPKRPQFNKVIGGGYPPASTFKMPVMLAALKERTIRPDEKIFCTGKTRVGNRDFHCWKAEGHGLMNMEEALAHSCDTYFYEIIQRLGMEKVKPIASALGFGNTFDLAIGGQISGVVPDPDWKQQKLGTGWRTGDELNASIGQGFVSATPLQLAVMTARLANGGRAVKPSLLAQNVAAVNDTLGLDPVHLKIVQEAMLAVCERPGGTAYRPGSLGIPGVKLAGKTGTGQVRGISAAERASGVLNNAKLPWNLRDHSIFVGYAPYDNPRFAASVVVEHGGSGAGLAATICRAMLTAALKKDGITETDAYVPEQAKGEAGI